jgi:histone deacetylase complex regulatory component SIN3
MPDINIASPSAEPPQAVAPAAPAPTTPTTETARAFLADLRAGVSPSVYTAFLDTMRMYKSGHMTRPTVVVLCQALLRDSADLTRGFMAFLPEGGQNEDGEQNAPPPTARDADVLLRQPRTHYYPYTRRTGAGVRNEEAAQPVAEAPRAAPDGDHDRAIRLVTSVKRRFAGSPQTYKEFLKTLHEYQKSSRAPGAMEKVITRVASLFADHADLREGFVFFLPDKAQAAARRALGLEAAAEGDAERESAAPESAAEGSASEGAAEGTDDSEEAAETPAGGGREESAQPEQVAVAGE